MVKGNPLAGLMIRSKPNRIVNSSLWTLLVLMVGFLTIWPLLQLQQRAFADGATAFGRMIALPGFLRTLGTTFLLAGASGVLALAMGILLAWWASLLPLPVRRLGQVLPLIPLMLPAAAAVSGWVFLLSPEIGYLNVLLRELPFLDRMTSGPFNAYSLWTIIIVTASLLAPFVYLFVETGFRNMGQDLDAAAAVSGAGPVRRLFTITLPLLLPAIVFSSIVVLLLGLGQFTVPLLLGRTAQINVLTTEMFYLTQQPPVDYSLGAALGTPIMVAGIVLVLVQRFLLREQKRYIVVSAKSRNETSRTSWWAAAGVFGFSFLTTVLPILALIYVSLSPFWTANISFSNLTLRHYHAAFSSTAFMNSIWTSVIASIVAVMFVIPLGFCCAFALLHSSRVPRPVRPLIDFLITIPVAVPASLLGFGLLFAYTKPPLMLYGGTSMLIVTYLTLMIGFATRLQLSTLLSIGIEFREASRACGAAPIYTLVRVILPMARTGIFAAAILTFVMLSHEFSASMMVRSSQTQVMGSVLYDAWSNGVYPQASVIALVMVAVTFAGVFIAVAAAGLDSLKKI